MPEPKAALSAYSLLRRRHQLFVDAYVQCGVGSRAMVETGYRGERARHEAWEILKRPDVQAAIAERTEEAIAEAGVTNHRILIELARIAFHDVTRLFDKDGRMLPIGEWPEAERAAIESTEVEETEVAGGQGRVVSRTKKVRMHDKLQALKILAQYKKLLVEQVEFPGGIPLAPPVFNIGFAHGGPGTAIAKRDPGT